MLDGFDVAVLDEATPIPAFEGMSDASGWRCYVLRVPLMLFDATLQRLLQLPEILLKPSVILLVYIDRLILSIYIAKITKG